MIDGRRRLTRSGLGPRIPEVARRGRELRARSSARARRVACHAGTSRTGASSRFPDRPTRWADLARPVAEGICVASLGSTIVALRDGRRSSPVACGCSAVGSASPCQGEGRGFESRHPLEGARGINPDGGVGRVVRQRPAKPCTRVRFPSPPPRMTRRRWLGGASASLTRKRSLVQSQYRAPAFDAGEQVVSIPSEAGHVPNTCQMVVGSSRSRLATREG